MYLLNEKKVIYIAILAFKIVQVFFLFGDQIDVNRLKKNLIMQKHTANNIQVERLVEINDLQFMLRKISVENQINIFVCFIYGI